MMTEYMKKFNADPGVKAYKEFMLNHENFENCKDCPENQDPSGKHRGCGQQHCWVSVHNRD